MSVRDSGSVEDLAARLRPGFTLGVAAAAFQIEGSLTADGRGPSGWDAFAEKPGAIVYGGSPAVACDHYNRADEDIALMQELGVDSYRLSLSWPRIQPDGQGAVNQRGLDFYDRLLDKLLAAGISPMVTLYHWDTPLPLEHAGGWMNRDTSQRLADYAAIAARHFGDRVEHWVTVNEPVSVTLQGYALGAHAPGRQLLFDCLPAAHHQLLGHGLAVQALRAEGAKGQIGLSNMHSPVRPASSRLSDRLMAEALDMILNRIYADAVLLGQYPKPSLPLWPWFRSLGPVLDGDLETISQPLDFYGLNYYYPIKVASGRGPAEIPTGQAEEMGNVPFHLAAYQEYETTGFGWPEAPEQLAMVLQEMNERYGSALPPVYITEGGASFPEPAHVDGAIQDTNRITYLAEHLGHAVTAAGPGGVAEGVDLRGYYVWTLLDNFEWAAGYSQRFGLVHVDFETLERTPKESFYWFRALAHARRHGM
ncbi:GH1 family beta-glucosidase [Paenarthrobacter sp. AB444]|uniref:GH1 family beta-glucosidase n=1 Tax=Paenarthrobacter sp. AB444 TaxID=3025681 RepID=UPI002365E530|nr:GH1 family beta-glucosidase [Paenarthrobacter sp. AB444]MDD7836049.1 GH1 family beta-glucosidase [Paenarthrobacter sp. AB444]